MLAGDGCVARGRLNNVARTAWPEVVWRGLTGPTVGQLMALCDENYMRLLRLVPELPRLSGRLTALAGHATDPALDPALDPGAGPIAGPIAGRVPGLPLALYLQVEQQAAHTTQLRLSYRFVGDASRGGGAEDPDAHLRVYHDARQVEVIALRQTALPLRQQYRPPALAEKWKANLFLAKWLVYCLRQGYRFGEAPVVPPLSRRGDASALL